MSISFNFTRLQGYAVQFGNFSLKKAQEGKELFIAKKAVFQTMPTKFKMATYAVTGFIFICLIYRIGHRSSSDIDLNPKFQNVPQPEMPPIAVPELPQISPANENQPGGGGMPPGGMAGNQQVGIIPANQPVQPPNQEYAKPQPKIFPVNILQIPQFECIENKAKLMIFVYTRPENTEQRNFIRKAWGRQINSMLPQDVQLWKTFFVMGRSYTDADQAVAQENMVEKDILMGDFLDTPFEDTRKFMMTMRWFTLNSKQCQPKFVMRTQDNVFQNMRAIMGWVEGRFENRPVITSNLYLGKILRMDRPIRDLNHALYVPVNDYNRDMFPEFIQSPVYFLTYQTFVRMSLVMSELIPIAMEDAYVGLLAEKVGLKPTHNDHFHMMSKTIDLCHHLKMFFIFNVQPEEHEVIFQQLKESIQKPECQSYKDADYF